MQNYATYLKDILYVDDDWVEGRFARIHDLAIDYANKIKQQVVYYVESNGGSSCGYVNPNDKKSENRNKILENYVSRF